MTRPAGLRALLLVLCALLILLLQAVSAQASIYWSTNGGKLSRSEADGTGLQAELVKPAPFPQGIVSNGAHIFWITGSGGIARAKTDGTQIESSFIAGGSAKASEGLALQGGHLYWHTSNSIGRATVSGTGVNSAFIAGVNADAGPVAADSEHVYFLDGIPQGSFTLLVVGRANLDGTGVNHAYLTKGSFNNLAVHGDYLYWSSGKDIHRIPKDEPAAFGGVTFHGEEGKTIGGLAAGPKYMFFTYGPNFGSSGQSQVKRAVFSSSFGFLGQAQTIVTSAGAGVPGAIALDPGAELPPVCAEKITSTSADVPLPIDLASSCSRDEPQVKEGGTPETFEIVSGSSHGSIEELDPTGGTLTYNPAFHYFGPDSFTFRAVNGRGASATTKVKIDVEAPPPPVCESSSSQAIANASETIWFACFGPQREHQIDSPPSHGSITEVDAEPGSFLYTPEPNYTGPDSFTYHAENASGSSEVVTMDLDVIPVACFWRNERTGLDQRLEGALECLGQGLTYEIVSEPEHGEITALDPDSGTFTYVPDSAFSGFDLFEFKASNGLGASEVVGYEILVGDPPHCEDVPVATGVGKPVPVALDCSAFGSHFYEIVEAPVHGSIGGFDENAGTLVYEPDAGFRGVDSFTYRAEDEIGQSNEATVTVDVGPHCTDVGAAGRAGDQIEVMLDCRGLAPLTYKLASQPEFGTIQNFDPAAGTLKYTAEPDFSGVDSFSFRATNPDGGSNFATAEIEVCSRPRMEVFGPAVDPERPGVDLHVFASVGEDRCTKGSEEAAMTTIRVFIDEQLVFSEERDCEVEENVCGSGHWSRSIPLPYQEVIGSHGFRVEGEDQFGGQALSETWSGETPAAGTSRSRFGQAEDKPGAPGCETPKPRDYDIVGNSLYGTVCADKIGTVSGIKRYLGGPGDDVLHGGGSPERLVGGEDDDEIFGGRGNDKIAGGDGEDRLFGEPGDDVMFGEGDDDLLVGHSGFDKIFAQGGNDLVRGGTTTDRLSGGGGENTLSYAEGVTPGFRIHPPGKGPDPLRALVDGFPGKHGARGVYVDLREDSPLGDNGETARYGGGDDIVRGSEFQHVIGTAFADFIVGDDGANVIDGGPGTDIIRGAGGADQLYGGSDGDYLDNGTDGAGGAVFGGEGADFCFHSSGTDSGCEPSESAPKLVQPSATTVSVGRIESGPGPAQGDLYVLGSSNKDDITATWNAGTLTVKASGSETAKFDSGQVAGGGCTFVSEHEVACPFGGGSSLVVHGNSGSDPITATALPQGAIVILLGGANSDTIVGSASTGDVLVDGPGDFNDKLVGRNGDDAIYSNEGKDSLLGGAGADLFASASICDGDLIDGGAGSDNANWAQLTGPELQPENPNYPVNPNDPDEEVFKRLDHGVEVEMLANKISEQGNGCGGEGEQNGTIKGVDHIEGSHGPDVLVGDNVGNVILGRAGGDVLRGLGGDDRILANNRNKHKGKTAALRRDLDSLINCGSGTDRVKMDQADKKHLALDGCEARLARVRPGRQYERPDAPPIEAPNESRDEIAIGAEDDEFAIVPDAFFKLDEATGSVVENRVADGAAATEVEGEPDEELGKEIEEEEAQGLSGAYVGGVELGLPGAIEGSNAIHLDGVDDHLDLTDHWDPWDGVEIECGAVNGYTVEMWVKFDGEASGREELFSRSEDGEGTFLYRSGDGRLNFSEVGPVEAPVVSTYEPVSAGAWHHVVATMADVVPDCPTLAARGVSLEDPEETSQRIALYVDGFPYALGLSELPFPPYLPDARNLLGAREVEGEPANLLQASIDDVAIYGSALSGAEIGSHLDISAAEEASIQLAEPPDLADFDEDGVSDSRDNCPGTPNPEQEDEDHDGVGDLCQVEEDADDDGIPDEQDNCPGDPNPLQEDINKNGIGDACEPE